MSPTVSVENVAERFVAYWLRVNGYFTNINSKTPGSMEIEARGSVKSLLVQVRAAVQPNIPEMLSPDELRTITSRAARLGFEPWEARVQLDEQLRQVGEIQWRKLS
jgi:hypothetical protein